MSEVLQPRFVRGAAVNLPTKFGLFGCVPFSMLPNGPTHIAVIAGDLTNCSDVLVRVHSECLTGDAFASLRCDCGEQLEASLQAIAAEGSGVVIYLRDHEGRGIGLTKKLAAYQLQDQGLDTVDANIDLELPVDARNYSDAAAILNELGVESIRLLTNNPDKFNSLERYGISVRERIPLDVLPNVHNIVYLQTKRERMGHLISMVDKFEVDGSN